MTMAGEREAQPSEEELQRRLEEQLRSVRVQDLLLESVAGIINLTARRIAKEDERDLEQARVGIEAVRAVLELLDEGPRAQVREALSQVQVLFAQHARGGAEETPGEGGARPPQEGGEPAPGPGGEPSPQPPPPRRPSGLWTPPGTS